MTRTLTEDERCALARIVMMRDCSGERLPSWIEKLAAFRPVSLDVHERLREGGFIVWSDGWHLTDAGWKALEATNPMLAKP